MGFASSCFQIAEENIQKARDKLNAKYNEYDLIPRWRIFKRTSCWNQVKQLSRELADAIQQEHNLWM